MNMKHIALLTTILGLLGGEVFARGGFGGGGSRAGGGGRGRSGGGGGGMSRPAARPAPRPSTPSLGGGRPGGGANFSRPNISAPAVSRPQVSRPQVNLPSGGIKPSTRPSTPNVSLPGGGNRPSVSLPNTGNRPNVSFPNAGNRPSTRPSIPDLGGGPSNRPGGGAGNRPSLGGGTGNRPNINLPNRPGGRPSPGDLGDFLGMDKPLRPETLPGNVRPGGNDRPGLGDRPGTGRPGLGDRPGTGRPGLGDRPINIGDIHLGNNNVINNRPSWANMDRNHINNLNNRWQNQIGGITNWGNRHPDRINHWHNWGSGVRNHWNYHNRGWFGASWWNQHPHSWCGWHYGYWFNRYPSSYWWRVPTYATCVSWFTWQAPATVWSQPIYYDYGQGGNVVYQDNSVYINGEPVATADEFAQSAADLATVAAPASEEEAAKAEWMPLGTFGVSANEKDVEPTRVIQLAVSKEGIISGTLYNTQTDQAQSVQGQVDKQTQRVAFRIGESENIVVETGLYNLTQEEAPALVHFGTDKVENWLLVRLENPEAGERQ